MNWWSALAFVAVDAVLAALFYRLGQLNRAESRTPQDRSGTELRIRFPAGPSPDTLRSTAEHRSR